MISIRSIALVLPLAVSSSRPDGSDHHLNQELGSGLLDTHLLIDFLERQ